MINVFQVFVAAVARSSVFAILKCILRKASAALGTYAYSAKTGVDNC